MKMELSCPECDRDIELDYDYTKVTCPGCGALLKLDMDAEYVDGQWRNLSSLIRQEISTLGVPLYATD